MDQNSSSSSTPSDTINPVVNPADTVTQTPTQPDAVSQNAVASDPNIQSATVTTPDAPFQAESYIQGVGESVVDLLDQIDTDDNLLQLVAKEMRVDSGKAKTILTSLLGRIDQEQITVEELALIMAASVVDEPPADE